MKHTDVLNPDTKDVHGNSAPIRYIGTSWRHSGNGKTYKVDGVTWLGATDEWGVAMSETGVYGAISVTRPGHHLLGNRDNGEPRYSRVY